MSTGGPLASGVAIAGGGSRHVDQLVELDGVARRVGDEGLAARPDRARVTDGHAPVPQLGHRGVEVGHLDAKC